MNKLILATLLSAYGLAAQAQDNPLWMRHPAISPDGKTIAFSYQGDIFTVPSNGGTAKQITSNAAFDSYPVWSPDGSHIAFASNREGSIDVWVMDANGGIPKRVTTNSGSEYPLRWKDNSTIMFKASIMPTAKSIIFAGSYPQVYTVGMDGGRPKLFSDITMDALDINASGDVLYIDRKGYEDEWRKHHRSPITRDVWLKSGDSFRKLTTFDGEDRDPVWSADGKSFYYLSEQSGTLNIYHRTLDGKETQITNHEKNPVRFLSAATDGTLCYGYDGEIYTVRKSGQPQKAAIRIAADTEGKELIRQIRSSGAYNIKLSPNGKEIGFVMHGDVYVTSIEYRTTKQITNTPEQERYIDFSPDGRTIIYDSERNGVWQIYATTIKDKDEKQFAYATELVEERLTQSDQTSFQPKFSPDGKQIAFWENRGTLRVMDAKGKNVKTAMDGKFVYSYSDGDIDFTWSPDSKWLLSSYIGVGGWNNSDIALVNASGNGEIHNLTESGYNESNAKWVLDGKAMLFCSDRAGYRSHGSWGAEYDAYLMFFDLEAYERFRMSKEERALAKENMTEKEKKKEEKKEEKEKKEMEKPEAKEIEPLKFDLENCRDRIERLTVTPSFLGDILLDKDGENIYYNVAFEKGMDLWHRDLMTGNTELLIKNVGNGEMMFDKSYKEIYLAADGGIKKVTPQSKAVKNIEFEAQFNYQPYKERAYMFDHVWRQVKDKFYDKNIHGVDWEGYRKTYERFLPYINNNHDFQEMLSEMLGELNVSHTGGRYRAGARGDATANLGLFYDLSYEGKGVKIDEVIAGGPFDNASSKVKKGCIIEKINGQEISADTDFYALLAGLTGEKVLISLSDGGKQWDEVVKPISDGACGALLYRRWIKQRAADVDRWSNGRLGYVHIESMDDNSFRTVYSDVLGKYNKKEGIVIDTRFNGGGRLHEDIEILFSGTKYLTQVYRGREACDMPSRRWNKPSIMVQGEANYSNAHGTPWVYKHMRLGKLVGAPVPGTMTSVWWERLQDSSLIFGTPVIGYRTAEGNYLENSQLEPDIYVLNSPEDAANGLDAQLKAAVDELLRELDAKK